MHSVRFGFRADRCNLQHDGRSDGEDFDSIDYKVAFFSNALTPDFRQRHANGLNSYGNVASPTRQTEL
jgi:hypothetical protein